MSRLVLIAALMALLVAAAAATAQFDAFIVVDGEAEDVTDIIDDQIAAVPDVSAESDDNAASEWLDGIDNIMTRVATGGLPQIPPRTFDVLDSLEDAVATDERLVRSFIVLHKVLHLLPSLWAIGFWYVPLDDWTPQFGTVYSRAVAAAKGNNSTPSDYDAAVNATARMVRFTKDTVFPDGYDGSDRDEDVMLSSEYLGYLPSLVAQLSPQANWTLTEDELLAFMHHEMHSKRDGMDLSSNFPTFVDTSTFWDEDAQALAEFVNATTSNATTASNDVNVGDPETNVGGV